MRVEINGLRRVHNKGGERLDILRGVDMTLDGGEQVAIVGPSGSGKSTFLHQLGLLDSTVGRSNCIRWA